MNKKKMTLEVLRTRKFDMDGLAIMTPEGDLDKFYPARIIPAASIGSCDTVEISAEFFLYITLLQDHGVSVVFRH